MQVPDSDGGPSRDRTGDRWIKRPSREVRSDETSRSCTFGFALICSGARHSYATFRSLLLLIPLLGCGGDPVDDLAGRVAQLENWTKSEDEVKALHVARQQRAEDQAVASLLCRSDGIQRSGCRLVDSDGTYVEYCYSDEPFRCEEGETPVLNMDRQHDSWRLCCKLASPCTFDGKVECSDMGKP